MSPTVFREGRYRFYFFSREEERLHIHIASPEGEAKFWLEPVLELAENKGLASRELTKLAKIVEEHEQQIRDAWRELFGS